MAKTTSAPAEDAIPKRNDAYTGFLAISFLAMVGGTVLLYLEYQNYEGKAVPKTPPIDVPGVQLKNIPNSGNAPKPPPPPPPMPMEEPATMRAPATLPATVTAKPPAETAVQPAVGVIDIPELANVPIKAETKPVAVQKPKLVPVSREPNVEDGPPLPTTRFSPPE